MHEMIIAVKQNAMKRTGGATHFVTYNSGYTIRFIFDDIWSKQSWKTAYFIYTDGSAIPVTFDGTVCKVPSLNKSGDIFIGISAGETLASEPIRVRVCESAYDLVGEEIDEIEPSAYNRIMEILNKLISEIIPEAGSGTTAPATETQYGTVKVKPAAEDMIADVGITEDGLLVAEAITDRDMIDLLVETNLLPATADVVGILADDDDSVWIL